MSTVEKLRIEDFKVFRAYIYDESGLFFSDAKLYFVESRVSKRMVELGIFTYKDYIAFIKKPSNKVERLNLFDAVTTNETSFYRNPPQVDAFANQILPKLAERLKKRGQNMIRIWSAACSSGEEPYTLAMILAEKKSLLNGLTPVVYATDISNEILAKAHDAVYGAYSMRNLSDRYKQAYFQKKDENFAIIPSIKSMVRVSYFNLVDYSGYSRFRNMDVIFCRNVLIYFDLKVKREIIKNFYLSLNNESFLMIGHSESLHNVNRDFKMEHYSRALGYRKPEK